MRIGQNPAKAGLKARVPNRLGVSIVTYIPNQTGYFEESLQIVKIEIASLRKNTGEEFDLYVFDNGSCHEVQNELVKLNQDGVIDFLYLSHHNVGKIGALNCAVASMPNEWIVYTDSDFFFRPNWLQESMKLAEAFPEAGMITAQPNIFDQLEGKSKAVAELDLSTFSVANEKLNTPAVEEYCRGIGASEEMRKKYLAMEYPVVMQKSNQTKAVIGACTAQFMSKADFLKKVFPLPHEFVISREEDNEICRKVDSFGALEISTFDPFVVHMGNHLDDMIREEIRSNGVLTVQEPKEQRAQTHKSKLAWKLLVSLHRFGFFRKIFKRLYVNLFELYSIEKK
jgi:Glycosyltransferases, probably involved in cell wall biogenesis